MFKVFNIPRDSGVSSNNNSVFKFYNPRSEERTLFDLLLPSSETQHKNYSDQLVKQLYSLFVDLSNEQTRGVQSRAKPHVNESEKQETSKKIDHQFKRLENQLVGMKSSIDKLDSKIKEMQTVFNKETHIDSKMLLDTIENMRIHMSDKLVNNKSSLTYEDLVHIMTNLHVMENYLKRNPEMSSSSVLEKAFSFGNCVKNLASQFNSTDTSSILNQLKEIMSCECENHTCKDDPESLVTPFSHNLRNLASQISSLAELSSTSASATDSASSVQVKENNSFCECGGETSSTDSDDSESVDIFG